MTSGEYPNLEALADGRIEQGARLADYIALRAEAAVALRELAQARAAKPAAWRWRERGGSMWRFVKTDPASWDQQRYEVEPLYAVPILHFVKFCVREPAEGWTELRKLVDEQAEDEGLWFVANTASEGYLQHHLRLLHEMIERAAAPIADTAPGWVMVSEKLREAYARIERWARWDEEARTDWAEGYERARDWVRDVGLSSCVHRYENCACVECGIPMPAAPSSGQTKEPKP